MESFLLPYVRCLLLRHDEYSFSTDYYEKAERKKREENAKRPIIIKGEITITTSTNPKINPNKKGKILTKRF